MSHFFCHMGELHIALEILDYYNSRISIIKENSKKIATPVYRFFSRLGIQYAQSDQGAGPGPGASPMIRLGILWDLENY